MSCFMKNTLQPYQKFTACPNSLLSGLPNRSPSAVAAVAGHPVSTAVSTGAMLQAGLSHCHVNYFQKANALSLAGIYENSVSGVKASVWFRPVWFHARDKGKDGTFILDKTRQGECQPHGRLARQPHSTKGGVSPGRGEARTASAPLPRWKATSVCSSAAPPKATSFSSEVRAISFPSAAGGSSSSSPTPGSPTAPIRLRFGRGRLGAQPLNFLRAAGQVGVRGAEVGRVGLRVVVAVGQGRPHSEPAWSNCTVSSK